MDQCVATVTKTFPFIAALGALAGCVATVKTDPEISALFLKQKAQYEANVGKEYWLTGRVGFCPVPSFGPKCQSLVHAHLKIDSVEQSIHETVAGNVPGIEPYYHATLDDGRQGYILAPDLMWKGTDIDPVKKAADCKRRGDPRVGMSAKQVEATCWGKPDHVNRTETAGAVLDQYVYENSGYVYLRNGVVTSVQTTGTLR